MHGKRRGANGSEVVFDAWAWWEVLHGTPKGERLWRRYGSPAVVVHTSTITLAEITSKLVHSGVASLVDRFLSLAAARSRIHPLTAELARAGGRLHADLRRSHEHASLVDGIVLACARQLRAPLISADSAFKGLADVRDQ